jgi:hypothetical protein
MVFRPIVELFFVLSKFDRKKIFQNFKKKMVRRVETRGWKTKRNGTKRNETEREKITKSRNETKRKATGNET